MPWCGQTGGAQAKHARLFEDKPAPIQNFGLGAGAVHLAQQRQRLPVPAKQDMGTVVDRGAVRIDPSRPSPERARCFEYGDFESGRGKRDRCSKSSVPAADDCDARLQYCHDAFQAIHALYSGARATRRSSTR